MKILFALALGLAPVAPSPFETNKLVIPNEFRSDNTVIMYYTDQRGIDKACGKDTHKGYYTVACAFKPNVIYAPNPCLDKDADDPDSYAHVMCHELAHVNGWHHINE